MCNYIVKQLICVLSSHVCLNWHGVKLGTGPRDLTPRYPGILDPGSPSKFKSGTRDPFKV